MFHSTPASEPLAIIGSLLAGLFFYFVFLGIGASEAVSSSAAMVSLVLTNAMIGAPINALMLDILALLIVRPLSPLLAAKVMRGILGV